MHAAWCKPQPPSLQMVFRFHPSTSRQSGLIFGLRHDIASELVGWAVWSFKLSFGTRPGRSGRVSGVEICRTSPENLAENLKPEFIQVPKLFTANFPNPC